MLPAKIYAGFATWTLPRQKEFLAQPVPGVQAAEVKEKMEIVFSFTHITAIPQGIGTVPVSLPRLRKSEPYWCCTRVPTTLASGPKGRTTNSYQVYLESWLTNPHRDALSIF